VVYVVPSSVEASAPAADPAPALAGTETASGRASTHPALGTVAGAAPEEAALAAKGAVVVEAEEAPVAAVVAEAEAEVAAKATATTVAVRAEAAKVPATAEVPAATDPVPVPNHCRRPTTAYPRR